MKFLKSLWAASRASVGYACLMAAFALVFDLLTGSALAADDAIGSTITSLNGYWTAISAIAIAIVLFVVGRKIIRKL
jgi:hypothetical protein